MIPKFYSILRKKKMLRKFILEISRERKMARWDAFSFPFLKIMQEFLFTFIRIDGQHFQSLRIRWKAGGKSSWTLSESSVMKMINFSPGTYFLFHKIIKKFRCVHSGRIIKPPTTGLQVDHIIELSIQFCRKKTPLSEQDPFSDVHF